MDTTFSDRFNSRQLKYFCTTCYYSSGAISATGALWQNPQTIGLKQRKITIRGCFSDINFKHILDSEQNLIFPFQFFRLWV